ncbi:MAG: hypothetical protein LBH00_11515 [Planctomycetaceae bacterium]|jgi:hypothetical protein|nr:hypothetical protein [Planctomycetaceae bacterium]
MNVSANLTFYPGYNGIKQYGHWFFSAAALLFSLLLDAFLIADFYWTDLISAGQRNIAATVLLGVWIILTTAAAFFSYVLRTKAQPEDHDEPFRQTICHYLRGDWFAAESQMIPYLQKFPKDAEMLLLQAAMYRRTNRCEEAALILNRLQLLDNGAYWQPEIERERTLLRENGKPENAAVMPAPSS